MLALYPLCSPSVGGGITQAGFHQAFQLGGGILRQLCESGVWLCGLCGVRRLKEKVVGFRESACYEMWQLMGTSYPARCTTKWGNWHPLVTWIPDNSMLLGNPGPNKGKRASQGTKII